MLVNLKTILGMAQQENKAIGAFNAPNLETLMAAIDAAEKTNSPIIIAHAEVHQNLIDLKVIGPIMVEMAKRSSVPICVHLDHGINFETCVQAMKLGFTSIMYDQSDKEFAENIRLTQEIVKVAHALNVSVEAELGSIFTSKIGGGEGRNSLSEKLTTDDLFTNPEQAQIFVEKTGVDALAIAFGTTHGVYLESTNGIEYSRISDVKQKVTTPLVMHGGSGLSAAEYALAIQNGIKKINYFTYGSLAGAEAVNNYIQNTAQEKQLFHEISLVAKNAIQQEIESMITIFNNGTH